MTKRAAKKAYSFKISLPTAKECQLLLRKKSDAGNVVAVNMTRQKNGSFVTEVTFDDSSENYVYMFRADGVMLSDKNAKSIYGREQFGKRPEDKSLRNKKGSTAEALDAPLWADIVNTDAFPEDNYTANSLESLVLYELHVRSFTMDKSSKVNHPGTFLGVTEKLQYIKKLGVTGLMLMPVFDFDECSVNGKINFWGYECRNTFPFAPKASYSATGKPAEEFLEMIRKFHRAGIDVYMDMMLSGDFSVSQIQECIRYYACTYGIDGFRINDDIIPAYILLSDAETANCRFFVSRYDEGLMSKYPGRVIVQNDGFKNGMRRYLKGDEGLVRTFYDYMKDRRGSYVSAIADHNGFCLNDLYSYDVKHNEGNGENNRDGAEFNYSWNCGEEGLTQNRKIKSLRLKMMKNAVASVMLSGGIPMLCAGDEFGCTKQGNNNTYCQDNNVSYVDWTLKDKNKELYSFVRSMIMLRMENAALCMPRVTRESDYRGLGIPEISLHGTSPWLADYQPYNRLAGVYLCGDYCDEGDGEKTLRDFYIIFNMHWAEHNFVLPKRKDKELFVVTDTSKKLKEGTLCGHSISAEPRSVIVLGTK